MEEKHNYPAFTTPEQRHRLPREVQKKCWPCPGNNTNYFLLQLLAKIVPEEGIEFLQELERHGLDEMIYENKDNIRKTWEELSDRGLSPYMETERFKTLSNNLIQEISCKDRLMLINSGIDLEVIRKIRILRIRTGTIFLPDTQIYKIIGEDNLKWDQIDEEMRNRLKEADQLRRNIVWALGDFTQYTTSQNKIDLVTNIKTVQFKQEPYFIRSPVNRKLNYTPFPIKSMRERQRIGDDTNQDEVQKLRLGATKESQRFITSNEEDGEHTDEERPQMTAKDLIRWESTPVTREVRRPSSMWKPTNPFEESLLEQDTISIETIIGSPIHHSGVKTPSRENTPNWEHTPEEFYTPTSGKTVNTPTLRINKSGNEKEIINQEEKTKVIRAIFQENRIKLYKQLYREMENTNKTENQCLYMLNGLRCKFRWIYKDLYDTHYTKYHDPHVQNQLSNPDEADKYETQGISISVPLNIPDTPKPKEEPETPRPDPTHCWVKDIETCPYLWRTEFERDAHFMTRHPVLWRNGNMNKTTAGLQHRQRPSTPMPTENSEPTTKTKTEEPQKKLRNSLKTCRYRNSKINSCTWVGNEDELENHQNNKHGLNYTEENLPTKGIMIMKEKPTHHHINTNHKPLGSKGKELDNTLKNEFVGMTIGRGTGVECDTGNQFNYSEVNSPLQNRSKTILVGDTLDAHNNTEIKLCPYSRTTGCQYVFIEDTEDSILVKNHIQSHLFQSAESQYLKEIGTKTMTEKLKHLTMAETIHQTQESNSYLIKEMFHLVNQKDDELKKTDMKRLTEEIRIIENANKKAFENLTKSTKDKNRTRENVIPVPDLTGNNNNKVENKELKHLPQFIPSLNSNKETTAYQLTRFLTKIYGYIKQRNYSDTAAILVLMDRLQPSQGRNPALEDTEMCIENYIETSGRQPTLKEITKNLEDKYCSEYHPENAKKRLEKLIKEEDEDNGQFAFRISSLVKRASLTVQDPKAREQWQVDTCLDIFISKIKNHERNLIQAENTTLRAMGMKELNMYEALKFLEEYKMKKDMYKEEPVTNKIKNHIVRQLKVDEEEHKPTQQQPEGFINQGIQGEEGPRNRLRQNLYTQNQTGNSRGRGFFPRPRMGERWNYSTMEDRRREGNQQQYQQPWQSRNPFGRGTGRVVDERPERQQNSRQWRTNTWGNREERYKSYPKEERDMPNMNDQDGQPQKFIDNVTANVNIGQCYKCGEAHHLYSPKCTKFNKPLAPEPCSKCRRGCHYAEDCLIQFGKSKVEEVKEEKTRRIEIGSEALQDYYDKIGLMI